jgi:hypothetical protein
MPWLGWQGKGQYNDFGQAVSWAQVLKAGTQGTAIVQDQFGQEVYRT